MTTFLLLRHAHSSANEKGLLAGQLTGIGLSKIGIEQSDGLVKNFADSRIDRIISSPLQRCLETVTPLAHQRKKKIHTNAAFIEMDYGTWSGKKLTDLARKREWKEIQKTPASFIFPEGEGFHEAQRRVERELKKLSRKYPRQTILIVTHGDIIKLALATTSETPLNNFQRYVVDTCSLSEIHWNARGRWVMRSNSRMVTIKSKKKSLRHRKSLGGGSGV